MRKVLTPAQMREMEARYLASTRLDAVDLMERAARTLAEVLFELYGTEKTAYFACGPGGNGGDGYACARRYAERGGICVAIEVSPPTSRGARKNRARAADAGVTITDDWRNLPAPEIWVDAVYGIGLSRAPEGEAAAIIERMNLDGADIVAVDIPSGLDALSGAAHAPCVHADLTVAFQCAKTGHYLGDGLDLCGDVIVRDIGIPEAFLPDDAALLIDYHDVKPVPRKRNSHKGDYGHLLVVAGSVGMAGAAAICAQAAMRAGAGLTTIACPASIVPILQMLAPCAMCLPLAEEDGALSARAAGDLMSAMRGKSCVAVGCGLSDRCADAVIRAVLASDLPAVFDADALNILARAPELMAMLGDRHVITPHPGEARRLLGRELTDPISDARALHALGASAILKGASSVICTDRALLISAAGCAGMAKGGSGDALTGIAGALIAQGFA
ncbi:MAG: NAD(P)H-hydrate dehydratase, partial [Christensenellales bacterium]